MAVKVLVVGLACSGLAVGSVYGYRALKLSRLDAEFWQKYNKAMAAGQLITADELKAAAHAPPDQDAAPIYRAAFAEIKAASKRVDWKTYPAKGATTEAKKIVSLVREARLKPRCNFGYDYGKLMEEVGEPMTHMKSIPGFFPQQRGRLLMRAMRSRRWRPSKLPSRRECMPEIHRT